jgi:hypothetical protein
MGEHDVVELHTFGPVDVGDEPFARADLELYRIDHFRPSFVARVFFNDPDLSVENASEDRPSYAGTFAVLGHQRCFGDEGHCEVPTESRRFDDRPSHPLTRAFRRVVVTDALRRVLPSGGELTVTLVVSARADDDAKDGGALLNLGGMQLSKFL